MSETALALERLASASERYLTETEADDARRSDNRRRLADATTDAWMLLRKGES